MRRRNRVLASADRAFAAGQRGQRRWRHSLRLRLVTLFVVLAIALIALLAGGMKTALSGAGWREVARPLLVDYMDRIVVELGSPPDVARAEALVERLPITLRIDGPVVQWNSDPKGTVRRGRFSDLARDGEAQVDPWFVRPTADGHRVTFGWAPRPGQRPPGNALWIVGGLALALILLAYATVHKLLKPLDDIRQGADRFGRGDFAHAIPLRRRDELGDLAHRINTMAHDLEGMLDAKRALLLALSHELRSPLTRARLNAELLPETPDGAAERAALLRDLNEMRDLISDLLESERLASPHAALQRERVDLAALVREVVSEHAGGAEVQLDLPDALPPRALDRTRVRLLVRNLLDNALRYSAGAARPPCITLQADGTGVRLEVRDFGSGVDESQLPHLTEPFYRTDSARQRATGGVGLGMYLCRLVAEAHGGRLELRNAQPGLAITVVLA
ncbi:MAG: HAMP domain-containing histidine kinase [Comamonadaceae bacterium]|nr:MAG: HAMP domain-containing histidine kinase [Comamonadaceae bacterium]